MSRIVTKAGETVTIGSFAGGYPTTTTWGAPVHAVDAGTPLSSYAPVGADPLRIWKTQPSLRKVVSFAARQVASVGWHAFQRVSDTDRQRLSDSAAEQLVAKPARFQSGFRFWELIVTDLMVYDLYCAVLMDGELTRIPPRYISLEADWLGRAQRIVLKTPASMDDIDLTDFPIMVGWGWSPASAGGVSPLTTLAEILDESRRSVEWRRQQWENSPKFDGILRHPSSFKSPEKRDRFLQSWRQWKENAGNGTPILEDGMEYERLDSSTGSREAENVSGRQLTDAEVASAFHIPPELVGARQGNFSNISAFRQMLFGPTLGPVFKDLTQAINAQIVPTLDPSEGIYLEPNLQAAIAGSFMEQAQVLQTMTGGPVMTRAEARARLNLPFIEGTDELVTPMNVTEGGLASPTDTGSQNRGSEVQSSRPRTAGQSLTKADEPGDLGTPKDQRDALVDALTGVYQRQREQVLAAGGINDSGAFRDEWDEAVAEAIGGPINDAALDSAWEVLRDHNPTAEGWSPEVMAPYLAAMAKTTAGHVNDGVIEQVNTAQADTEGTPEERIGGAFDVLASSAVVAWTSTITEARSFGGYDAAKASGVGEKTWRVESSNPRDSHRRMNGETVAIDDRFSNGAKWPGDPSLDVDDLAGCRCGVEFTTY